MGYKPLDRRRLSEQVCEQLEDMIARGQLVPGDVMPPEKELVSRFEVSRLTIREALLALQQKGLVDIRNGERVRVTEPSLDRMVAALSGAARLYLTHNAGIRDFQNLRRVIEIAVVREVAGSHTPEDLTLIETCLVANQAALSDPVRFAETDVAFHEAIVKAAKSPLLSGLNQALAGWLRGQRDVTLAHDGVAQAAFDGHAAIFKAIAAGNANEACDAMDRHLRAIERFFWQP